MSKRKQPRQIQLEDGTKLEVVGEPRQKPRKRKLAPSRYAYQARRLLLMTLGIAAPVIVGAVITWLRLERRGKHALHRIP